MTTETLPNWKILESLLKRDWWESELACRIFTGFVRYDYQGKGSSRTRLSGDCLLGISGEDFQNGKDDISPGSPLFSKIHEKLWDYQTLWKYAEHKKSPNNFRNEDEWSKEYCVSWALIKKIDIPWLDWAIGEGYLPANISGDVDIPRVDLKGKDEESGQIKTDNLLRLMSILVEMMVDPNKKSTFTNQAAVKEYIAEQYEPYEEGNKGLSKDSLSRTFAAMNKVRKPNKIFPDD